MNINQQKILVTGASGSIGKQLLYELTQRSVKPIAHVRATSDTRYIDQLGLEKRVADIRIQEQVAEIVKGVDAIIHTVAWVNFRQDKRTQFTGVNTMGALDLYKAAVDAGVKRFVQVSSVATVGARPRMSLNNSQNENLPVDENHKFNLGHLKIPYILTKRAAEDELFKLSQQPDAPELVIVNPSIVLTPSDGRMIREKVNRLMQKPFLPDYPNIINVVDIRDTAKGIVLALEKGKPCERYILGGENVSAHDLVLNLSKLVNHTPNLIKLPRWLVNLTARLNVFYTKLRGRGKLSFYPDLVKFLDYDLAISSAKATQELGYTSRPLQETLKDLVNENFI